jgi:hypothetical protein
MAPLEIILYLSNYHTVVTMMAPLKIILYLSNYHTVVTMMAPLEIILYLFNYHTVVSMMPPLKIILYYVVFKMLNIFCFRMLFCYTLQRYKWLELLILYMQCLEEPS